jgi:phospholipase C
MALVPVKGAFAQKWPGGTDPTLLPFHLHPATMQSECTHGLSHEWQAEHASWNNGKMDKFVSTHTSYPAGLHHL